MPDKKEILVAIQSETEALVSYVRSLTDEELNCACTESEFPGGASWRVVDHLTHLVESERVLLMLARQGVEAAGSADPTIAKRATDFREGFFGHVHEVNQETVEAKKGLVASEVLDVMDSARSETLDYIESLGDEALGLPEPQFPFSDGTVGGTLIIMALHHKMHLAWIKEGLAARMETSNP